MNENMPTVVLDPGHGGNQRIGGSSPNNATGPNGLLEKDLTLDVARRTRDLLRNHARVILTRDDDVNLSLSARAAVARNNDAALFISIHFNGFSDRTVDGTVAFIARQPNPLSRALAQSLVDRVVSVTNVRNRGVKQKNFGVLLPSRHAPDTGVCLLEVAFLTNASQAQRLEASEYRDQIAGAIAEAVRQHLPAAAPAAQALNAPQALEHVPGHITPDYRQANSFTDALRMFSDWLSRGIRFTTGVHDPTFFPHSAICQLQVTNDDGSRGMGTGFYIAPDRILTVAHNLALGSARAVAIDVFPGRAPNMSTFPEFRVTGAENFLPYPKYNPTAAVTLRFADFDLGVIKVNQPPPNNEFFEIEEQRMSPISGMIVCGYAADGNVNRNQQNMDVDSIRDVDPESFTYALQIRRGSSGAPVFYVDGDRIIATGIQSLAGERHVNRGCRLTDEKIQWIRSIGRSQTQASHAMQTVGATPQAWASAIGGYSSPRAFNASTSRPWPDFFPFDTGTRFRVDGPFTYDGNGRVRQLSHDMLEFEMHMPAKSIFGIELPRADLVIAVTYRQEGGGNQARIEVNGQVFTDNNLVIHTEGQRRRMIPSIAIPGQRIDEISVMPDGPNEIDLDVVLNGRSHDFDLERLVMSSEFAANGIPHGVERESILYA